MAYDEGLAHRVRGRLAGVSGYEEKKMFGGLCSLMNGNMCCGVAKDTFMVRVGPESYEEALRLPHAREMDFTGRPLKGMVYVDSEGIVEDSELAAWVDRGMAFAGNLPAKKKR